jgi:hypothetical protein
MRSFLKILIFGGPLLTEGIIETLFPDHSGNLHPFSIAFDGTFYWVVGGGNSLGDVAQLDANFNLVDIQSVTLDCRSVFYNPADDNVYIKSFNDNGLYRLNRDPFNGGYDGVFSNLFQDSQSKVCLSADGSLLYDHLDGNVIVYEFATGLTVNTIFDCTHRYLSINYCRQRNLCLRSIKRKCYINVYFNINASIL